MIYTKQLLLVTFYDTTAGVRNLTGAINAEEDKWTEVQTEMMVEMIIKVYL